MAFQTSHSTPQASSTSDGSSSTSAYPTAPPNPNAAGSPPLILAFLAIGLFSAAMIVVFGWRRVQLSRGWALGGFPVDGGGTTTTRNEFILAQKPKLWDVWNAEDIDWSETSGSGGTSRHGWRNIMPLSATIIPNGLEKPEPSKRVTSFRRGQPNHRRLLGVLPRRPRRHREDMSAGNDRNLPSPGGSSTTAASLQVALSILMPSSSHPLYIREEKDNHESRSTEISEYEFSVGVYSCPWPYQ
ncbi:hypothetical protein CPC08DRAFT_703426 [Agrocybe pediades]|nr:hypothetical protein CPC08DRAFT_703426 [Agrocybe pediades]